MANDQQPQDKQASATPTTGQDGSAPSASQPQPQSQPQSQAADSHPPAADFDGLEGKKPDELTPEELRLMADTMPGEGPGD